MKFTRGIRNATLVTGVLALLALNLLSQRSLHEARAEREGWESERKSLEDSLRDRGDELAALGESTRTREKQLLETVQRQADERHELKQLLGASQDELRTLVATRTELEAALSKAGERVAELEATRGALEAREANAIEELEKKRQEYEGMSARLGAVQVLAELLEARTAKLEELSTTAQSRLLATLDELAKKLEDKAGLDAETARLRAELLVSEQARGALEAKLRRLEETASSRPGSASTPTPTAEPPAPTPATPITGAIAAIDAREALVVVDVGERAGLARGMLLDVLGANPDATLARLRVVEVFPDYSGCEIESGDIAKLKIKLRVASPR